MATTSKLCISPRKKPWCRAQTRRRPPTSWNADTYRWHKHFLSDAPRGSPASGGYWTAWAKRCPIAGVREQADWPENVLTRERSRNASTWRSLFESGRSPHLRGREPLSGAGGRAGRRVLEMREITYNEAILEATQEEFRRDPRTVYMATDLVAELQREFGPSASASPPSPRTSRTFNLQPASNGTSMG